MYLFGTWRNQCNKDLKLLDNRYILPFNFPIRIITFSIDVIHAWTISSLGIKIDSKKLLDSHELENEKSSVFLQRLYNLATNQVIDAILKSIFVEQLPKKMRTILAISEVQDLVKLAIQTK